jgi:methylphosphotriester-DNA--protein-cysteine methyltransferase
MERLGGAATWTGSSQVAGMSAGARMINALEVGYTSPSAFAQVFRRVVGVTPTEFRRGS